MKKIILFQPRTGEWDFAGIRPPDSLLSIAAAPYARGYNIKIIDQRIDKNWKNSIKREIKDALLFGTTSMTGPQIKYALEASAFAKEICPEIKIVWGGVHASLLPEETIKNRNIDIVIKGEGDFSFLELAECIEKKGNIKKVKGIFYKEDGIIKNTGEKELIKDLDLLPDLPYNLIDLDKYYGFDVGRGKSITLMTSRGCPYRCAFCYNTVYYKNTWRGMSSEKTVSMIKRVVEKFRIKNIFFQDDNFCANISRFEQIVDGMLREKIDIKWGLLGTRIDTLKKMQDSLLKKSVSAGCMDIDVGIESGSERILNLISKDVKLSEVFEVNKRLSKFFDKTKYTFIMGIPTETEKELMQTVKVALKLSRENKHVLPLFFIYSAYPGTKLYELAIKNGFVPPKNLEEWSKMSYETSYQKYPWIDERRRKILKNLEFTSMFANKNNEYKINSKFLKIAARIYRPLAKIRFERNFYQFPIDRIAARMISRRMD